MSDITKKIFGEDYERKMNAFDTEVAKIEAEHIDWFEARENSVTGEKPDRLGDHFIIGINNPQLVRIGFLKNSVLPQVIIDKVNAAFRKQFEEN